MGIQITVLASAGGQGLDLAQQIRLVKAAIMYADHVTLASPQGAMIAILGGAASLPGDALEQIVLNAARAVDPGTSDFAAEVERLRRTKRKSVQELLFLRQYEERLSRSAEDMRRVATDQVVKAGGNELALAINAGLLDVDTLGLEEGNSTEQVIQAYVRLLTESVAPDASTFPLLDDEAGRLLGAMQREGLISGDPVPRATESALAGTFIETVDSFPEASMDEILAARTALQPYLTRFRAALAAMANGVDVMPWEPRFANEAASLYRIHVAPALEELRDMSEQLGLRRTLGRHVALGSGQGTGIASVVLALTAKAALPELLPLATLAIPASIAAAFASDVYKERTELADKRSQNKMVFLYEADRELGRGRRR
jgi:hypothetical protein